MSEIRPGSKVVMHFSITLEDGTVAENSFDGEPLGFTMGDGTLNEGFELGLYGMKAGDEDTMVMLPEQTFGFHDPENIHEMPITDFDSDMQLDEGVIIGFTTPAGDEVPGMIKEVGRDTVRVDFNHPLAGHELTYKVKILKVSNPE
jgi:FKBP-type peptidyl-prolyl cis-trans isomerase SlpA